MFVGTAEWTGLGPRSSVVLEDVGCDIVGDAVEVRLRWVWWSLLHREHPARLPEPLPAVVEPKPGEVVTEAEEAFVDAGSSWVAESVTDPWSRTPRAPRP